MLDSMIPISKTHPSARNRFILDLSSPQPELSKLTLNPFKSHQPLLRGILTEPFRRSNTPSDDDESVDSFLRRRFGGTISDLGSAGMHGIYASSSTQLSARAVMGGVYEGEREYGSVLLGMMRRGWKSEVREEKREVKEEGGVEYVWVERWFAEFVGSVGGGGEALGRGYQVGREGHWSSRG